MLRSVAAISVLLLASCASNRYCLGDQPYAHAPSVPPLQPVEGLKLPESSAALKIPPPSPNPVPFGQKIKDAKGEEVVECLDRPPPMATPAEEKAPEQKPSG